jgi:hypothetical protein
MRQRDERERERVREERERRSRRRERDEEISFTSGSFFYVVANRERGDTRLLHG